MMFGTMERVGCRLAGAFLAASLLAATPQALQAKELSDRSVRVLMNYAWMVLPHKFTTPQGKTIEVDKSKKDQVMVPVEVGREVIKVARLSAHAQICELLEEQVANYQTLMRREVAKKKWSDQQLLYINQIHLFTILWLTGKVKIVEQKDGEKNVEIDDKKAEAKVQSCTEEQKKQVREQILAYIKLDQPKQGSAAPASNPKSAAKK